jgi:hypothetical protein
MTLETQARAVAVQCRVNLQRSWRNPFACDLLFLQPAVNGGVEKEVIKRTKDGLATSALEALLVRASAHDLIRFRHHFRNMAASTFQPCLQKYTAARFGTSSPCCSIHVIASCFL